jgi:tripeptide aminopeptidase
MNQTLLNTLKALLAVRGHSRQERPVADFVLGFCRKHGIRAAEDRTARAVRGNAGNIIARARGASKTTVKRMFAAHMDTVDVGPRITARVSGTRISAGADHPIGIDNRLGVALLLTLLAEKPGAYACIFTVQEEIGMFGAQAVKLPAGVREIFVMDGSQSPGHFVLSTAGGATFEVNIRGLDAHAGINPNGGRNAVQMAARAIADLTLGMPGRDVSVNIGVINGGTRSNVIPARATVIGEVRANRDKTIKAELGKVRKVFEKHVRRLGGTMRFSHAAMFRPYAHADNSSISLACRGAVEQAGLKPVWNHYRGGSDANVFNRRGVDAVNLSIGAHNPHSRKEYTTMGEMMAAYRILCGMA